MMFKHDNIFLSSTLVLLLVFSLPSATFAKPPPKHAKSPKHRIVEPKPEPDPVPVGTTELVSKANDGTRGNGQSHNSAMTPDGRYVVFVSSADNLVSGDTNAENDVFVHDRLTGNTERVSVASDGTQADDWSYGASISGDGRHVAFYSYANNLVPGEQTYFSQVYVHDRMNGITERVSISTEGTLGNASSSYTAINGDGRYVAFTSSANNLVAGDNNGYYADIFVRDRLNGITERISVASDGSEANHRSGLPTISTDGQTLAFLSDASNLVPGDTNNTPDIFVHNRISGITERVSVTSNGAQSNGRNIGPSISANGQVVTFTSDASNLVSGDTNNYYDVFVHDRSTAITERVSVRNDGSQASDESFSSSLSEDGRYVAFLSYAVLHSMDTNLWMSDIYLYDRVNNTTEIISLSSDEVLASEDSGHPEISADGRFVAFDSYAPNLVAGDSGYTNDVFVRDRNPQ